MFSFIAGNFNLNKEKSIGYQEEDYSGKYCEYRSVITHSIQSKRQRRTALSRPIAVAKSFPIA